MMIRIQEVQVSDTTGDDSSNAAKYKNKRLRAKREKE
jgi:hypothetical protein